MNKYIPCNGASRGWCSFRDSPVVAHGRAQIIWRLIIYYGVHQVQAMLLNIFLNFLVLHYDCHLKSTMHIFKGTSLPPFQFPFDQCITTLRAKPSLHESDYAALVFWFPHILLAHNYGEYIVTLCLCACAVLLIFLYFVGSRGSGSLGIFGSPSIIEKYIL
jgi:hypothetical protein